MYVYMRFKLFYERKLSPSGEFRQLMKKNIQRHCSLFFYDVEMVIFYVLIIPICITTAESFIHIHRNTIEH